MQREKLTHLRLSEYAGWSEGTLRFLPQLDFLEYLDLWSSNIRDVIPLYSLPQLKGLSLNGVTAQIDFSRFPRLRELSLGQWRERSFRSVFDGANLEILSISGFRGSNLSSFSRLQNLESLALSNSPISSLTGIESIGQLIRLSLVLTNKLEEIDRLPVRLRVLWVERTHSLRRLTALATAQSLRTLVLKECPRIESLKPIQRLPCLETVGLMQTTNVLDGDLGVLLSLPRLQHATFLDRNHYNVSSSQFPKKLPVYY